MNIFNENYEFRFARLDETDEIMSWLDKNWKKNHIMATNKELFLHELAQNDRINMFLAKNKQTSQIEAIWGVIYTANGVCRDCFGTFWKSISKNILLGTELAKRFYSKHDFRYYFPLGSNPKTAVPIQKAIFKCEFSTMKHYYLLNEKIKHYEIAKIAYKTKTTYFGIPNKNFEILKIKDISQINKVEFKNLMSGRVPYKDLWYVKKRFFDYPIYKYDVYAIYENYELKALFVIREQKLGSKNVLRIVDYLGEQKSFVFASEFLRNLFDENTEYIDFYAFGFDDKVLEKMGFIKICENDRNIIPNYFSPFIQKNIDIYCSDFGVPNVLLCKADCDQDRPN